MAIVSCTECNGKISTSAVACPHCGNPLRRTDGGTNAPPPATRRRVVTLPPQDVRRPILGIMVSLIVVGAGLLILGIVSLSGTSAARKEDPFQRSNPDPKPVSKSNTPIEEGMTVVEGILTRDPYWTISSRAYGRRILDRPDGDYDSWLKDHAGQNVKVVGKIGSVVIGEVQSALSHWRPHGMPKGNVVPDAEILARKADQAIRSRCSEFIRAVNSKDVEKIVRFYLLNDPDEDRAARRAIVRMIDQTQGFETASVKFARVQRGEDPEQLVGLVEGNATIAYKGGEKALVWKREGDEWFIVGKP